MVKNFACVATAHEVPIGGASSSASTAIDGMSIMSGDDEDAEEPPLPDGSVPVLLTAGQSGQNPR